MSSIRGESIYLAGAISSLYTSIQSLEDVVTYNKALFDSAVAAFDSKDVELENMLNTHITNFDTVVAELQNADTTNTNDLTTHISNYDSKTAQLDYTDSDIQIQIDAMSANFSSKSTELDILDSDIQFQIDTQVMDSNNRFNNLDNIDSIIQDNVSNHVSNYDSKTLELDATDAFIQTQINHQVLSYAAKMGQLDDTDTAIQIAIDNHSLTEEGKMAQLDITDAGLTSQLTEHIATYDSKTAELDATDASLSSQLTEHIATYDSKTAELDATDTSILSSLINQINTYNAKIEELEMANNDINQQIGMQIMNHNFTVENLAAYDSTLRNTIDSNKLDYDTKIEELTQTKATLDSTFASISSRVDGLDTDIIDRVSDEINSKVNQTEFDNAVASLMAVDSVLYNELATKVTEIAQAAVDSTQNELIASKLDQTTFDATSLNLDSLNSSWEERFRIIEETFKTILATYTITKSDNTLYNYDGTHQKLSVLPPVFGISAKKTTTNANDWVFTLQFTPYGYNTLLGTVSAGSLSFTKADIDSTTLTYDLLVPNSRSGDDLVNITLPFEIVYNSYNNAPVFSLGLTAEMFSALPLDVVQTPESSTIWGRWLNSSANDYGLNMTVDATGNVYIVGTTYGDFSSPYFNEAKPSNSSGAGFIVKYSASGDLLWGRWIDSSNDDEGYGVATDSTGNVYVTGTYYNSSLQSSLSTVFDNVRPGINTGSYIIKFNSIGVPQWGRSLDGSDDDNVRNIACDSLDNVYVCGFTADNFQNSLAGYFDEEKPNMGWGSFVFKYDTNGTPQWGRWLDSPANEYGMNLATDTSNNVYVVGTGYGDFQSSLATYFNESIPDSGNSSAGFIVKFNSSGVPQWGRWVDSSFNNDEVFGIAVDAQENVYITGYLGADAQTYLSTYFNEAKPGDFSASYIIKFNSSGIPQWGRWIDSINGGEEGRSLTVDSNGDILVVGYTTGGNMSNLSSYFSAENDTEYFNAGFVMKFSSSGTPIWGRWIDGNNEQQVKAISADSNGNFYISGFTNGQFTTDINSKFDSPTPSGGWIVFLLKMAT